MDKTGLFMLGAVSGSAATVLLAREAFILVCKGICHPAMKPVIRSSIDNFIDRAIFEDNKKRFTEEMKKPLIFNADESSR